MRPQPPSRPDSRPTQPSCTSPRARTTPTLSASDGAALLLVRRNSIPSEIAAELTRLNPMRIVVIGGAGAINEAVFGKLKGYAGEGGITRLGGIDRYETARTTVREHWTDGSASLVYVASGQNFPDALSAAAAAGTQDAPVITLNGSEAHLDAATAALIKSLGATEIIVAGGAAVVSDGIVNDLAAISGVTTVRRLFGTDRYATSAAINTDAFSSASRVYLASGNDFPDALAGTVRAAADNAPLYIVPGSCIPRVIADSINVFGPIEVTLIGGAAVLPLNLATAPICR